MGNAGWVGRRLWKIGFTIIGRGHGRAKARTYPGGVGVVLPESREEEDEGWDSLCLGSLDVDGNGIDY